MTETYQVVLTAAEEGGYTVTVPDIRGCITEGDTVEEALTNARDAIETMLEYLASEGRELPRPLSVTLPVRVDVPLPVIKAAS